MPIRAKTVYRVGILAAVALVLVVAGVYFIAILPRSIKAEKNAKRREEAMAMYNAGDYARAVEKLGEYLDKARAQETDPEALYAYGVSRKSVEMQGGRHLREAMNIFELYLRLKPGDPQAQRILLELYPRVRFWEEAAKLADDVLAGDPNHPQALRARAEVYANATPPDYPKALEFAERLNAAAPLDLDGHRLTLGLLRATKTPPDEVVRRYDQLRASHPDDPRFELLLALAHDYAGNRAESVKMLRAAATHPLRGPDHTVFALQLALALELKGLFAEALKVLDAAAPQPPSATAPTLAGADEDSESRTSRRNLIRLLVQRLWQNRRFDDVLERLKSQNPDSPEADGHLLAFKALSLYGLNKPAEAAPIVDALAQRKDDASLAWSGALLARYGYLTRQGPDGKPAAPPEPRELVAAYQKALDRTPRNAVIQHLLGEAYASMGETEQALRAWGEAASISETWSTPAAAVARTLAATGRGGEAVGWARAALLRSPELLANQTGYLLARFAALNESPDAKDREELLHLAGKVQKALPNEPETLHIYVTLLARAGRRDEAADAVDAALKAEPPVPAQALMNLASVSMKEGLGLEQAILDRAAAAHGDTPMVTLGRALAAHERGRTADGFQLLLDRKAAAGEQDAPEALQWQLAVVQYRESTRDPQTLVALKEVGDANPDNQAVQMMVLRSPSRFADRAFWARTVDRVKALAGEESHLYRMERARWLLSTGGGDDAADAAQAQAQADSKAAAEALDLLKPVAENSPGVPEPHRLLGLAYERAADAPGTSAGDRDAFLRNAIESTRIAATLRPADAVIASDLARMLRTAGRTREADEALQRLAANAPAGGAGRRQVAAALAAQAEWDKAIRVLEETPADGAGSARDREASDVLLASLYRRKGGKSDLEKAAALYRKALESESAGPEILAAGADFFASQKDQPRADEFLARLSAAPGLQPWARDLLLGRHAERHTTAAEAEKHYGDAVAASPKSPAAWSGLVGFYVRARRFDDAAAAAERGLKALPDDESLQSLKVRATAMRSLKGDPDLDALAEQLAADPRDNGTGEMLKVLAEAGAARAAGNPQPDEQVLEKLQAVAHKYPRSLPLQAQVVRALLQLGKHVQADEAARRAAAASPTHPEPQRLLTAVAVARGDWEAALSAARRWRERSAEQAMQPDLTIAQALLQLKRPREAAEQLEPYASAAAKAEDGNVPLAATYARALIASGRKREADDLLAPLAERSPQWLAAWTELATAFTTADAATQWLERAAAWTPGDNFQARLNLADAWYQVGRIHGSAPAHRAARDLAAELTKSPDGGAANAGAWLVLAVSAEALEDLPTAESAYRKLLKLSPQSPEVKNNLAYVLLERGNAADLPEAKGLAEQAVATAPQSASFHDTLARVQVALGEREAAVISFENSLKADGNNVEAMIGLADVLSRGDKIDDARALLTRIDTAVAAAPPLPRALREQLDAVRAAMSREDDKVKSGRIE